MYAGRFAPAGTRATSGAAFTPELECEVGGVVCLFPSARGSRIKYEMVKPINRARRRRLAGEWRPRCEAPGRGLMDRARTARAFRRRRQRARQGHQHGLLRLPHEWRLAAVIVPAYCVIMAFSGRIVIAMGAIGAILGYAVEALGSSEGAVAILWITTVAQCIGVWVVGMLRMGWSWFAFFLLQNVTVFLGLAALWAMLHVRWVWRSDERVGMLALVCSGLPMPSAAVWSWGVLSLLGVQNGHFSVCGALLLVYKLVVCCESPDPAASACKAKQDGPSLRQVRAARLKAESGQERRVVSRGVAALHAAVTISLPCLVLIFTSRFSYLASVNGLSELTMLVWAPIIAWTAPYAASDDRQGGGDLWWLGLPPRQIRTAARRWIMPFAAVCLAAAAQSRLERAFGGLLPLYHTRPGLARALMVSLTLTGFFLLRAAPAAVRHAVSRPRPRHCLALCAAASAAAGLPAILLGTEWYVAAVAIVAGAASGAFVVWRRAGLLMAAVSFGMPALYGILNSVMGWLDLGLNTKVASTQSLVLGLAATAGLALAAAGGCCLNTDALSAPGAAAAVRAAAGTAWIAACLSLAALELYFSAHNVDVDTFPTEVYPGYMVVATTIAGIYATNASPKLGGRGSAVHVAAISILASKLTNVVLPGSNGLFLATAALSAILGPALRVGNAAALPLSLPRIAGYAVAAAAVVGAAEKYFVGVPVRFLFDVPEDLPLPRGLRAAGVAAWTCAVALAVCARRANHRRKLKRRLAAFLFASLATVTLFAMLAVEEDEEDPLVGQVTVFGISGSPLMPGFFGATVLGFALISGPAGVASELLGAVIGGSFGLSAATLYLPFAPIVGFAYTCTAAAGGAILAALHWTRSPAARVSRIAIAIFVCGPTAGVCAAWLLPSPLGPFAREQAETITLVTHASLSFLIALRSKVSAPLGAKPGAMSKRAGGARASAALANLCVTMSIICGVRSLDVLHHGDTMGLLLSPVCLLLQRDGGVLSGLAPRRRWAPVLATAALHASSRAAFQIISSATELYRPFDMWFIVKNSALMAATLPSVRAVLWFLWTPVPVDVPWLMATGPLAVLPILAADLGTVRVLGLAAAAGTLYQAVVSRRLRAIGEARV